MKFSLKAVPSEAAAVAAVPIMMTKGKYPNKMPLPKTPLAPHARCTCSLFVAADIHRKSAP